MRISDWSSDVCSSDLERPLCVNSAASLNAALPARAITSLATPDNERNNVSSPPNVRGTRAGRGSTTFNPNCLASSYAKPVAPILGMEGPPVAITSAGAEDRKSVVSGKSVSVRVDLGGRRIIQKKTHNNNHM